MTGIPIHIGSSASRQERDAFESDPSDNNDRKSRHQLPQQFDPVAEIRTIVPHAESQDNQSAKEHRQRGVVFGSPPQNAGKSSKRKRNATNTWDRLLMDFAFPWLIYDMEPSSQKTQWRNQRHANEQRSHETEK